MNPSTPTQVCALGNTVNSVNTANSVSTVAVANDQSLIPLMAVGTEWASVAASSPVSTANRFTALFDKQSVDHHTDSDAENQQFTEVRRSKRRRIRTRSNVQQPQQQQQQQQQQEVRQRKTTVKTNFGWQRDVGIRYSWSRCCQENSKEGGILC